MDRWMMRGIIGRDSRLERQMGPGQVTGGEGKTLLSSKFSWGRELHREKTPTSKKGKEPGGKEPGARPTAAACNGSRAVLSGVVWELGLWLW